MRPHEDVHRVDLHGPQAPHQAPHVTEVGALRGSWSRRAEPLRAESDPPSLVGGERDRPAHPS
jgi:hypothetical protein